MCASAYYGIDRFLHRDAGDPHSVGHRDLDFSSVARWAEQGSQCSCPVLYARGSKAYRTWKSVRPASTPPTGAGTL
jgi:hypothetical protein